MIQKNIIRDLRVRIAILAMKSRSQWYCTYRGMVIAIAGKIERSQRNDRDRRKMIAIATTDSFYFSSMILNDMQLMGSCDFEK